MARLLGLRERSVVTIGEWRKAYKACAPARCMVAVLLDTNIYGKIFADRDGRELVRRIKRDKTFVILNFRLIRNELRGIPKILPLYDQLAAHRIIVEAKQMNDLARAFLQEYRAMGGRQGQKKMMNDFKIVACATLINCDLVVFDDMKTLLHSIAVNSYKAVNLNIDRRTPTFYTYRDLKQRFV